MKKIFTKKIFYTADYYELRDLINELTGLEWDDSEIENFSVHKTEICVTGVLEDESLLEDYETAKNSAENFRQLEVDLETMMNILVCKGFKIRKGHYLITLDF